MNRVLCTLFVLLFVAPAAISAADGPPSVFYVRMYRGDSGSYDLVKIDTGTDTLINILSVEIPGEGQPITLESLSSLEWLAFQQDLVKLPSEDQKAVLEKMSTADVGRFIDGVWETRTGDMLIERRVSKCFTQEAQAGMPPLTNCYGVLEFNLLEIAAQQERMIWTVPYHKQTDKGFSNCYGIMPYENYSGHELIDQVLLHPARDVFAVRFWGFGCAPALFLVDYSVDPLVVTELSDVVSAAWSPDGTQMAYLQGCDYGVLDLATLTHTLVKTAPAVSCDQLWVGWPAADTLVFPEMDSITLRQGIVWHTLSTNEEETLKLDVGTTLLRAITLHEDGSGVVLAIGDSGIGYFSHPNVAFTDQGGAWTDDNLPTAFDAHSSDQAYAFTVDVDSGAMAFVDADVTLYPVDLEPYRVRYGADRIEFAMIGAEQP